MHANVRITVLLLALGLGPVLGADAAAQGNPACALLSEKELSAAAGLPYGKGTPGDNLGEGIGGGASCQWGGADFMPGEDPPMVAIVFIPASGRGSYTETQLSRKPARPCTRETLRGIGDVAFLELCERDRGPAIYARAGRNDIVVVVDPEQGKPLASARPRAIAIAKAVAPKARGQ